MAILWRPRQREIQIAPAIVVGKAGIKRAGDFKEGEVEDCVEKRESVGGEERHRYQVATAAEQRAFDTDAKGMLAGSVERFSAIC
jgi:hypothetical protein